MGVGGVGEGGGGGRLGCYVTATQCVVIWFGIKGAKGMGDVLFTAR